MEDRLSDNDILALTEVVGDLVLGLILLHAGEAFSGGETSLFLVFKAFHLFELALVLVVVLRVFFLVLRVLLVVFPIRQNGRKIKKDKWVRYTDPLLSGGGVGVSSF